MHALARCDVRTRCSACKGRCAGCNARTDQSATRTAVSVLHFPDDPTRATCRTAPGEPFLTSYDMDHLVTYLRLLDADADGARLARGIKDSLSLDVEKDPDRANRVWQSHLTRAKWMTETGYRHLLRGGAPS